MGENPKAVPSTDVLSILKLKFGDEWNKGDFVKSFLILPGERNGFPRCIAVFFNPTVDTLESLLSSTPADLTTDFNIDTDFVLFRVLSGISNESVKNIPVGDPQSTEAVGDM
jgi:hypothetical protein